MIDEKIIIEKLKHLKDEAQRILKKPYATEYITPDQFCYILDMLIEYIDKIKVET